MRSSDLYIYTTNKVSSHALINFNREVDKLSDLRFIEKAKSVNNEIFNLISEFNLEKLFISITTSDSIFYRFKLHNSSYEFKWEAFITSEENSNFESTLHIYNNRQKQSSTFGATLYIYNIIIDILFNYEALPKFPFEFFGEYKAEAVVEEYA